VLPYICAGIAAYAKRQAIAEAFERVIVSRRYTVWGCAVLTNHAHLCIRKHRDDPVMMWRAFAEESAIALRRLADVLDDHPVWSSRPYRVFLHTPDDVRRVLAYIADNPLKERLAPQSWSFVRPYDGWPYSRQTPR